MTTRQPASSNKGSSPMVCWVGSTLVAEVVRGGVDAGGDAAADRDAELAQLRGLVGVVGEQVDAADAEGGEHLGGGGVVAAILREAEGSVRLVGVVALVRQRLGAVRAITVRCARPGVACRGSPIACGHDDR